jgi:Ca-activated chloride channel family protein
VTIDAGFPLESVRSPSHAIEVTTEGRVATVVPAGQPVLADRDLVLRWKPRAQQAPDAAILVEDREDGRYALLMLMPPAPDLAADTGLSTDTLFVVDVSGSMAGPSIEQARETLLAALERLRPDDAFNLLRFSDRSEPFRDGPRAATAPTVEEARRWVLDLEAGGGTEIVAALVRGLELIGQEDGGRARRIVLITDGAVADEEEAYREVARRLGDVRLHVVGIGSAPNRHLMRELAELGRGACELIASIDEVGERMDAFLSRLERPVLTDVALDWGGAPPVESYPERLPDLYAGTPLYVSLELGLAHPGTRAMLSGRTALGRSETELAVDGLAPRGSGIATRWARAKVEALLDGLRAGAAVEEVRPQVVELAREFNLMTPYTSLVAVEELATAAGPSRACRVASARPFGSQLGGELAQGGTDGPLLTLVGLSLTAVAVAIAWAARLTRS